MMTLKIVVLKSIFLSMLLCWIMILPAGEAQALSRDRFTNGELYGVFFNDYDANFYTGFAPRVQEKKNITIHVARGNQVRIRMVLTDAAITNYLVDQVARYDLYQEVIDKNIITLTSNMAWEAYQERFKQEKLAELVAARSNYDDAQWKQLNLDYIEKLTPGRLHHIQKDFSEMVDVFYTSLAQSGPVDKLEAKLDLINGFFPHRIFATDLSKEQDAAFAELVSLVLTGDRTAFTAKAGDFFQDITGSIYTIADNKLDFYEFTSIYAIGTYDGTTKYKGKDIPNITTNGVWWMTPRMKGAGIVGMIDYISPRGYYGVMPWMSYQHAGGALYNAFHNPGISNWLAGHPLMAKEWLNVTEGSRNGKPFIRLSITSRGPVSSGCTRLNPGQLTEFREMLPSTSKDMEHIMVYRSLSPHYDVYDLEGDGRDQVMGVQYYIAFRHTNARVAQQIWAQNNRKDFYQWLYGNEINYGPIGEVTFDEIYDAKYIKRKAIQGSRYENIGLYEAPYEPEYLQFYVLPGTDKFSRKGVEFNQEMRRVGYGYDIDRGKLLLEK